METTEKYRIDRATDLIVCIFILQRLQFDSQGRVSLGALSQTLEQELLVNEADNLHKAAVVSCQHEIKYLKLVIYTFYILLIVFFVFFQDSCEFFIFLQISDHIRLFCQVVCGPNSRRAR